MRVMCSCLPAFGHYVPMVGIAKALQVAGHDVTFVTAADFAAQVAADGFKTMAAGEDMNAPVLRAISAHPEFFGLSPSAKRAFILGQVFGAERLGAGFEELLAAARIVDPDVLLHDPAEYAAPLIGEVLARPNVCVGYGLILDAALREAVAAGARPSWEALGRPAPADAGLYRHLYLDPCPPGLADPAVARPPTSHRMRPVSLAPADGYTLPATVLGLRDRPLVYATFGTIYNSDPAPLRVVVDGLRRLAVNVVVTVGPQADPAAVDPHDPAVAVERFIPQAALLPQCALVITHGGSGSILGPLAHGIPLVVVPQGADQFDNAAAVERATAGVVIMPDELTPERIADAADQVLHDPELRAGAARLAAQLQTMPHPTDCVAHIEQLAQHSR